MADIMIVNTRQKLIDYCMRELGAPVLKINVDDIQVDDRIDEALQYFQMFHHDGTETTYLSHQITADDITNKYIALTENVIGITRIFPLTTGRSGNRSMFDIQYQMRLNELYDFTSVSFVNYVLTQSHISTINILMSGETSIRFNRHTDRLYIDWDWDDKVAVGDYIIAEARVVVDPDTYTDVYSDRMLKKMATALIKRQWGANMKKYGGLQLPGGILMNGKEVFDEADAEVLRLEAEIRSQFESPPMLQIG